LSVLFFTLDRLNHEMYNNRGEGAIV